MIFRSKLMCIFHTKDNFVRKINANPKGKTNNSLFGKSMQKFRFLGEKPTFWGARFIRQRCTVSWSRCSPRPQHLSRTKRRFGHGLVLCASTVARPLGWASWCLDWRSVFEGCWNWSSIILSRKIKCWILRILKIPLPSEPFVDLKDSEPGENLFPSDPFEIIGVRKKWLETLHLLEGAKTS